MASGRLDRSKSVMTCVICCHEADFYCMGDCNHPVCFECSIRIRAICQSKECPICRKEMADVIMVADPSIPFSERRRNDVRDKRADRYSLRFDSPHALSAFNDLLAHVCTVCKHEFEELQKHMRKEHDLFYCGLCVEDLNLFSWERKCYTRQDLATHRRIGDADDRSHRGHPLCKFCDTRFLDEDYLYKHLRRDHFHCHFCEADSGLTTLFYDTYDELKEHFRGQHLLCEEGDCRFQQFIGAFRTELDLKSHKASVHKGKDRVVNVEWGRGERKLPQAPSAYPRGGRGRGGRYGGRGEDGGRQGGRRSPRDNEDEGDEIIIIDSNSTGGSKINTIIRVNKGRQNDQFASQHTDTSSSSGHGFASGISASSRGGPTTSMANKKAEFQAQSQDFPTLGNQKNSKPKGAFSTSDGFQNFAGWGGNQMSGSLNEGDFPTLSGHSNNCNSYTSMTTHHTQRPTLKPEISEEKDSNKAKKKGLVMIDDDEMFPSLGETVNNPTTVSKENVMPTPSPDSPSTMHRSATTPNLREPVSATYPAAEDGPKKSKFYQNLTSSAWNQTKTTTLSQAVSCLNEEFPSLAGPTKKLKGQRQARPDMVIENQARSVWKATPSAAGFTEECRSTPKQADASQLDKIAKAKANNKVSLDAINWSKTTAKKSELQNKLNEEEEREKEKNNKKSKEEFIKVGNSKSKPRRIAQQKQRSSIENSLAEIEIVKRKEQTTKPPPDQPRTLTQGVKAIENLHLNNHRPNSDTESPRWAQSRTNNGGGNNLPPPGFDAPPGFSDRIGAPPPGFEKVEEVKFQKPFGFDKRNQELFSKLSRKLTVGDLGQFKSLSRFFRHGDMSAEDYAAGIQELLGKDFFAQILPELLVLLPDIPKQKALLSTCQSRGVIGGGAKSKLANQGNRGWSGQQSDRSGEEDRVGDFRICRVCGQVLAEWDHASHLDGHSTDQDFPALR